MEACGFVFVGGEVVFYGSFREIQERRGGQETECFEASSVEALI